jgi:small-conductance mechanosensitive channel
VLTEPAPTPYLTSFGADGINLELGFWIADAATGTSAVRSAVNRNIWKLFSAHGIAIPFAQREVRIVGNIGNVANVADPVASRPEPVTMTAAAADPAARAR